MIARAYTLGISRREFAGLDGCSEARVRQGISEGRLPVLADGSLDKALAGTPWRKGNTKGHASPKAEPGKRTRKPRGDAYPLPPAHDEPTHGNGDTAASVDEALRLFEQQAAAVSERVLNGASYSDALRIKENYLALLRQLEYSIKSGAVVELAAEQAAFDLFRTVRDAWIGRLQSLRRRYSMIPRQHPTPDLWREVDNALMQTFRRDDGRPFSIMAACIDSGGHATQAVYAFAKERIGRRVWAIKGESARTGQRSPVWPNKKPTRRTKASYRPVILGVNAAKDAIRDRLALDSAGPRYMHFPADRDLGYYAQLTAERIAVKEVAGHRFYVWELPPGRANEALDARVYAYGAL